MSVERIVGIDFGTSTSVIRVKRYKDGKPVDDRFSKIDVIFGSGSQMVPTLIQKTSKGTYFGYEAEIQKEKGETLYQNFKINLESDNSAKKAEARELTEEFFSYLGKEYRAQSEGGYLGDPTDTERTIVSYPVKWSEDTKSFMINAAKKAGFKNVEGMDEAQAAIHAVTVQYENLLKNNNVFKNNVPCNILLVDMGAGTTDLVMCCHTPGKNPKTDILCTWPLSGDILFGGREVDEKLIEYVKGLMEDDDPRTEKIIQKVGIKEFKSWKETVVSPALQRGESVETFSKVDDIADLMDMEIDSYGIDRSAFERYLADYLRKLPQLINGCIKHSGLKNSDIDLVILTGGHSQWYFVENMLKNTSVVDLPKIQNDSKRILKITRPQETVALGMVFKPLSVEIKEKVEACAPNNDEQIKNKSNYQSIINMISYGREEAVFRYYRDNMPDIFRIYNNLNKEVIVVSPEGKLFSTVNKSAWLPSTHVKKVCTENRVVFCLMDYGKLEGFLCNRDDSSSNSPQLFSKNNQIKSEDLKSIVDISLRFEGIGIPYSEHAFILYALKSNNTIECFQYHDGEIIKRHIDMGISGAKIKKLLFAGPDYEFVIALLDNNRIRIVEIIENIRKAKSQEEHEKSLKELRRLEQMDEIRDILFHKQGTTILKNDGSIITTEKNFKICNSWNNIKSIYCSGGEYLYALQNDGTVLTNTQGELWKNIISLDFGYAGIFGLTKDGEVLCDGEYAYMYSESTKWHDIIAIKWTPASLYGIQKDGRVIYTHYSEKEHYTGFFKKERHVNVIKGSKYLPFKLF